MNRRKFFTLISLGGIGAMGFLISNVLAKRQIIYFVKSIIYRFKPAINLPKKGKTISIETALNSRCTSDYNGNPVKFHWGMFDRTKKLSIEQITKIASLSNQIPRFTEQKVEVQFKKNILTFIVENSKSGIMRDWMMIESGMQQQAVGLICAAMGAGMVFRNLGKDGTSLSDTEYGTIKVKIDPMNPSYSGSFWSNSIPDSIRNPWAKGNLPAPVRDGAKPLLSTLTNLKIENNGSLEVTEKSISQLLWADRGRTPHFYISKPWGMTIPTWAGKQEISSVYFISDYKLHKYTNWDDNRPTHALIELHKIESQLHDKLIKLFSANHGLIILGRNEDFSRAFWEIGYQLLNLLLQANSLDISYRAVLLDMAQKTTVAPAGIKDPVALFAI